MITISRDLSKSLIKGIAQQGSNLNPFYPWMGLPYFASPSTGVPFIVNEEVTIYGDTLINVPITNNLNVTYACDIGTQSGNNFILNPVSGNIGVHALMITFKNGNKLITENTINLVVYAKAPATTKKMLIIGDSLITNGINYIDSQISGILTGTTINYLGTQGTTIKHEGRGGWTTYSYIFEGPFVKDGVLNIPAYFTDNAIDTPDVIYIRLGVNDIYGQCNGDFTDLEVLGWVGFMKQLVDGFLAFNSSLKVILGLPTLTGATSIGWNIDYDENVYIQDKFIEYMHKYWVGIVSQFDGYNSRLSINTEVLTLDRDTGYNLAAGGGVHPNSIGYTQIGTGIAIKLNEYLKAAEAPTELTAIWVDNYAKIDFIDNTGGVATHEIWESKNGGEYSLVTTLVAGTATYNNYTWQNANMIFKVIAKNGDWYSDYSAITNLSTPLVLLTNQSTLTNFVFRFLNISAGKTINVDWGDGTNANYTGSNSNVTKTYSVTANPYYIKLSGDINSITYLTNIDQVLSIGSLTKWILPTSLKYFDLSGGSYTGNLSQLILPLSLEIFNIGQSSLGGFTGDISSWVLPNTLLQMAIGTPNPAGLKLTGDLSSWIIPTTTISFNIFRQDFTALPTGNFKQMSIQFLASENNVNTANIDSFLEYLNTYYSTNTPLRNQIFSLNNAGMGIPSASGLAARTGIQSKFTTAGFTATININT